MRHDSGAHDHCPDGASHTRTITTLIARQKDLRNYCLTILYMMNMDAIKANEYLEQVYDEEEGLDQEDVNGRSRSWVFTVNNYTSKEFDWPSTVAYATWQCEVGLKKGTPHLQGFIQFKNQARFAQVRKALGGGWCQPRLRVSTDEKARDYCRPTYKSHVSGLTKMESGEWVEGPWEFGEFIVKQERQRSDLECFRNDVKDGVSRMQLMTDHCSTMARYPKFEYTCKEIYGKPRDPDIHTHITCIYGPPGAGKSRKARDMFKHSEVYFKNIGTQHWWSGYNGQEHIIIDEFDKIPVGERTAYLEILDRMEVKVAGKGEPHVQFIGTKFILLGNLPVKDWWLDSGPKIYEGVQRRINGALGKTWHMRSCLYENVLKIRETCEMTSLDDVGDPTAEDYILLDEQQIRTALVKSMCKAKE